MMWMCESTDNIIMGAGVVYFVSVFIAAAIGHNRGAKKITNERDRQDMILLSDR